MRVLHVVEATEGGVALHLRDLVHEQLGQGLEVEILHSTLRPDRTFEAAIESFRARNVPLHTLAMHRDIGPHDFQSLRGLRAFLRSQPVYDLIHAHSSKAGAIVRLLGRTTAARVYTPHALVTMDPLLPPRKKAFFARVERVLAKRCERIALVSNQERDHARSIGLPAEKLRVVPLGISPAPMPSRAKARKALGVDEDVLLVGFIGRLTRQKAPEDAITAFAQAAVPGAKLALIGYGPLEPRVRALSAQHGVEADVMFLGNADGPALCPAFDVLLLTSRYESFGYVLMEAAHAGAALVSTPVGVAPDLIQDGVTGRLVPIGEPSHAAAALRQLLLEPAERSRLATAAREAMRAFSVEAMAKATLAVYKEALKAKRPRL